MSRQAESVDPAPSRLYALILRSLLPSGLRCKYGPQMHETFARLRRDARVSGGLAGELVVWWREIRQLWMVGRSEARPAPERRTGPSSAGSPAGGFDRLRFNLRQAMRGLRRAPGFTLTVVMTLALGIGANATMFGVIDRLLLRAPEYVNEPEEIVRIYVQRRFIDRVVTTPSVTYPDFVDFAAVEQFEAIAAVSPERVTVGHGEGAQQVRAVLASASLFPLLSVRPALGRFFSQQEDVEGAAAVVVLGYGLWHRWGADPDIVGSEIRLGGAPHTIVGVAPEGMTGIDLQRVDLWLPLHSPVNAPAERWEGSRGYYWLRAVARLTDGATLERATAEATALHRAGRADDEYYDAEASVVLGPLVEARGVRPSDESVVARWLTGVSITVLLIACANVANMLLTRGVRRRRETGVRLALGISRGQLVVEHLTESVLLALGGGIAALAVAYWGALAVRAVLLPDIHWPEAPLNPRVMVFTFGAAVVSGIAAGVVPGLQATRQNVLDVVRGGRTDRSAPVGRSRPLLLVAQAALSVVLLVGAGLFVKSVARVRAMDLGFEPEGLVVAMPEFDGERMPRDDIAQFFAEGMRRLRGLPAVEDAAASASLPFYWSLATSFEIPGREELPVFSDGGPYIHAVSTNYLATAGIRIIRGRGFTPADDASAPRVVIIGEDMAEAYWPDEDPLGKCVRINRDEGCTHVVGIAESANRGSLTNRESAQYYVPLAQWSEAYTPNFLVVRAASGQLDAVLSATHRELLAASDAVRFVAVHPFRELIDPSARSWRLGAALFSAFGVLALVIASLGLYGVLAFNVAERRREIGVRSALGASARGLVAMIAWQAARLVLAGLSVGAAIALAAAPWLEPMLFEVDARDPAVLAAVAALLALVAIVASTVPALRAARVQPVIALRQE